MKKAGMAIMMAMLAYTTGFAFEDSIMVNDKNSFSLFIGKVHFATRITLLDKRQNALFDQSIEKDSMFAKLFNVELLQEGEYSIRIEDRRQKKEIPLTILVNNIQFDHSSVLKFYKPVIHERGERVYINQFSPTGDPLYVTIFDKNNNLVYKEKLKGQTTLGKIYDFSQSMPGSYRVYCESKGGSMIQDVLIK